ncbi:DUF2339 domain-containing protein [Nocardia takedensis]|uniref:DUF2339 domain-containing protein n=1 Tax=Nocardia takedensis TaxID=259390 RepID=UPI00030075B4|nr:DUF2339 domain-containing protein [Nocardia takedensis]
MTTSLDPALIARLSGQFTTLGTQMDVLGRELDLLYTQVRAEVRAPLPETGPARPATGETSAAKTGSARGEDATPPLPGSPGSPGHEPAQRVSAPGIAATSAAGHRESGSPGPGSVPAPGIAASTAAAPEQATGAPPPPPPPPVPDAPVTGAVWPGGPYPAAPQPAGSYPAAPPQAGSYPGAPFAGQPGQYPGGRFAGGVPPRGVPMPPPGPGQAPRWGGPAPAWPMPVPPRRPVEPRTPWWQREGVISRVLAVAGVGVTLIGVVMLLVLAAQAGIFGPVPRVLAGAVFSAALVGAGVRVAGRSGGRVGGIALTATGIAGAYLDVVAVTALYHWLHPVLGLAVALGVAAGGVALAMKWQSQPLAVLVVAGVALLSPGVSSGLVLLGFLIVLQLVCLPVHWARDWPVLHVVRTVPAMAAALALILLATLDSVEGAQIHQLLAGCVAIAAVGVVGTLVVVRRRANDLTATVSLAMSLTPLLVVPVLYDRMPANLVAGVTAAVLLALGAQYLAPRTREFVGIPGHTATVAAVAGSFALLELCFGVTDARTAPAALLLVAIGYLAVAGQRRSGVAAILGAGFGLLGGMGFLSHASPENLAVQRLAQEQLDLSTVLAAVVLVAAVAVAMWSARSVPSLSAGGSEQSVLWIGASAVGLYALTAATVSLGVVSGAADGFVLGHSVATILWMVAATGALFYGLRNLATSPSVAKVALGSGLLVTAAALAKLFLFDLATLDGLVRVAAFLVVGVLLLVAGTRYARAFAEANTATRGPGDEATR